MDYTSSGMDTPRGIAPSRRSDLSRIGLRAMVGGTLAAFMTATVAGMIL